MKYIATFILIFAFCHQISAQGQCQGGKIDDINEVRIWLTGVNQTLTDINWDVVLAEWNWATDITDAHEQAKAVENAKMAEKLKEIWSQAACIDCEKAGCSDEEKRRVKMYYSIDTAALPPQDYDDYGSVQTAMENIYSTAKVCRPGTDECLQLDPGLSEVLAESRDYCELQWAWEGWRNETGRKMRGFYSTYVLFQNQAANLNGYASAKEMWTKSYLLDEPDFFKQIEAAWQQVKPLYVELHKYARWKLQKMYGTENFPSSGHIPAHLFGNMWAQDWTALYNDLVPYPDSTPLDITALLKKNGTQPKDLFYLSDEFFQSIGLEPMTKPFWDNSVFLRPPPPKEMVCHASAWDFYKKDDFRIKMCTVVNMDDFQTVHHEMGHIQYFMQYKDQPVEFRDGANPGFHEAIGDLIALSVMTPTHLKAIKLLPADFVEDNKTSLNALMSMALQKVPFMPFGYLMDKFRWGIFKRDTKFSELNKAWWDLRCDMQGVSPPVPRTEEDFDAGAKYHIPASTPYIRYFFSHIAQFQFHKAICEKIGWTENFHQCDIYNNKTASADFVAAMALGSSKPYPEVLELLTGTPNLDAQAMMDYFDPLYQWLIKTNKANGVTSSWQTQCPNVVRNNCNYAPEPQTTTKPQTTEEPATEPQTTDEPSTPPSTTSSSASDTAPMVFGLILPVIKILL